MEQYGFDSQLEQQVQGSQEKQDRIYSEIKKYVQYISPNQEVSEYYYSLLGCTFDKNNTKQLLNFFSYCYMKRYGGTLTQYLQNIQKDASFAHRRELFSSFKQETYTGNTIQNIELYHFLVQQVEIKKIIGQLTTQSETRTQLSDLQTQISTSSHIKNISSQIHYAPVEERDITQFYISEEKHNHDDTSIQLGVNTQSDDEYGDHLLNPERITSAPFTKSSRGSPMCSLTARVNLENLGVHGPILRGNANTLSNKILREGAPVFTDTQNLKQYLFSQLEYGNVFDIYPKTRNGHRAVVFGGKNEKGNPDLFVLDPYYDPKSTQPVSLDEYMTRNTSIFNGVIVNPIVYKVDEPIMA